MKKRSAGSGNKIDGNRDEDSRTRLTASQDVAREQKIEGIADKL